jgi:hypothetical protein
MENFSPVLSLKAMQFITQLKLFHNYMVMAGFSVGRDDIMIDKEYRAIPL